MAIGVTVMRGDTSTNVDPLPLEILELKEDGDLNATIKEHSLVGQLEDKHVEELINPAGDLSFCKKKITQVDNVNHPPRPLLSKAMIISKIEGEGDISNDKVDTFEG
ncbi:hypothetical protein V6N12_016840 [Hibiscus sabdariffa]|uniref:Uncharacterized protein n=1 Tax=Hibiscus sabdariffa TaxID=183260 RepID=A0ABR2BPA4_9ROSI